MSRPALIEKLMQAGGWLLKPGLVPIDDVTIKRNQTAVYVALDALIRQGGGLAVGQDKRIYVDFSLMPTDAFEELLKSIRVPVWLTKNINIYVAPAGSDTLDEGRGLTEEKPFHTVQAAVSYASTTYNLYQYNLYIRLAPGIYDLAWVELPDYSTSTGVIVITGDDNEAESTIIGGIRNNLGGVYYVHNCTVRPSNSVAGNSVYAIQCTLGQIQLSNVVVDFQAAIGRSFSAVYVSNSGVVLVPAMSGGVPEGVKVNTPSQDFVFLYVTGGRFSFSADLKTYGDTAIYENYGFCYVSNGGSVVRQASGAGATHPSRLPVVTAAGTITGKRYQASANGIINTNGAGADFFPGSIEGDTRYGGQYI